MIFVGIDDTDMPNTRGTNQLARHLVRVIADRYRCERIVRHQLCTDSSIPCTSKNGSASIWLEPLVVHDYDDLRDTIIREMRADFIPGSDPGLCITDRVPEDVISFGRLAQRQIVTQGQARNIARDAGIELIGLGGTEGGVIGALSAVGLAATADDGRVIHWKQWSDDLAGVQEAESIWSRGVIVRHFDQGNEIHTGRVYVGKHLRPNCRNGNVELMVTPHEHADADWSAVKMS
ncbi:MAG: ABC transporter substrate-binding protein [Planctomycetota bacterium]|nr:ABC transporter substrate-binding protein [Planctomycetota bacterium]MDA1213511.1 ABC transporter substrate-binding protein [Planctomycetota bacterium]